MAAAAKTATTVTLAAPKTTPTGPPTAVLLCPITQAPASYNINAATRASAKDEPW
jgi:hypothetical protein